MTQALANAKVPFEKKNPLTLLMSDTATGTLREEILDEKILSAIVEIKVDISRTEEIVQLVHAVEREIDTVVALGEAPGVTKMAKRMSSRQFWSGWATSSSVPKLIPGWGSSRIL